MLFLVVSMSIVRVTSVMSYGFNESCFLICLCFICSYSAGEADKISEQRAQVMESKRLVGDTEKKNPSTHL